ncbi:MAG: hypothetical protein RL708_1098 [Bacteroidota bacterium]|jgi:uncharacterized RDD family membrane protein YckC
MALFFIDKNNIVEYKKLILSFNNTIHLMNESILDSNEINLSIQQNELINASRSERFLAAVIDSIILAILIIPITYGNLWLGWSIPIEMLYVGTIVSLVYKPLCEGFYSQTVGKKIMKIKVVSFSNENINWGNAILRNILQIAYTSVGLIFSMLLANHLIVRNSYDSISIPYTFFNGSKIVLSIAILIDVASIWFHPSNVMIHDRIGKTKIIKVEEFS